jgi:DnaJ family protein C protein 28
MKNGNRENWGKRANSPRSIFLPDLHSRYHEESIKQLNSTVRKYNGAAPYAVRRPYFSRSAELDRCYERSAEVVLDLILKGKEANLGMGGSLGYGEERGGSGADAEVQRAETNVWDVWKTWVRKVFGYTNRAVSPP